MPDLKISLKPIKEEIEDAVNRLQPRLTGVQFSEAFKAEANRKLREERPMGIQRLMALEKLAK